MLARTEKVTLRKVRTLPGTRMVEKQNIFPGQGACGLQTVHPTRQYTNLNLLVNGVPVAVKAAHAKNLRDGYRRAPVADNGK
jgi:hypothetical protein